MYKSRGFILLREGVCKRGSAATVRKCCGVINTPFDSQWSNCHLTRADGRPALLWGAYIARDGKETYQEGSNQQHALQPAF
jgi:hypothetical protein